MMADVVDQHVGAANLSGQAVDVVLSGHVGDDSVGVEARRPDPFDVVLGPLLVDLGHDHMGARRRQRVRRRSADPAASSGDDRDFAGQIDLSRHPAPDGAPPIIDILCDPWSRPRARRGCTSPGWLEGAAATRRRCLFGA